MLLEFDTGDVFTAERFGGNPLAVVHGGEALDTARLQAIAREFNLSETVFVLPPRQAGTDAFIRIFTPGLELPFAGHPNVGCAVLLARRRSSTAATLVLDQAAGPVTARLQRQGGVVTGAEITAPRPFAAGVVLDPAAAAACCGLPDDAIASAVVGGCGTPMLLAQLARPELLAEAAPDAAAFRRHLPASMAIGLLLFTAPQAGAARARMFGTLAGVPEDPATGAAAVALAGLLLQRDGIAALDLIQGVEMGRPSLLRLRAWREGSDIRAAVGGGVVPFSSGRLLD